MSSGDSSRQFEGDAGAPLPDFSGARNISLTTVAPALGVGSQGGQQPDYLDFDQKGRGVVVTMFANAGMCYLVGIGGGGKFQVCSHKMQCTTLHLSLLISPVGQTSKSL